MNDLKNTEHICGYYHVVDIFKESKNVACYRLNNYETIESNLTSYALGEVSSKLQFFLVSTEFTKEKVRPSSGTIFLLMNLDNQYHIQLILYLWVPFKCVYFGPRQNHELLMRTSGNIIHSKNSHRGDLGPFLLSQR